MGEVEHIAFLSFTHTYGNLFKSEALPR